MKKKNQSYQLRSRFVSKILLKSENECENEQKNQSVKLRSRFVSHSGFLYPGPESNRHSRQNRILNPARLPVPPPGLFDILSDSKDSNFFILN